MNNVNKNCMSYWFPELLKLGIPVPKTELIILEKAPYYTNQLEVLIQIAKSIPVGYKVFVKEHYAMKTKPSER